MLLAAAQPDAAPPASVVAQDIDLVAPPGGEVDRANPNPGIIPLHATPGGKTYGEWAAAYWQWVLSIPEATNPTWPFEGFCDEGQSGPVWFYAYTFGFGPDPAERSCTMPTGKMLFMPVFPWVFGSVAGDCEPTNPGVPCDVPTLQAAAAAAADTAEVLEVTIDGVPVQNVFEYRAASPGPFSVTLPAGAVFGIPEGTYDPNVADGYWLMLTPLPPGEHTIESHVVADGGAIEYTVITHLTVVDLPD